MLIGGLSLIAAIVLAMWLSTLNPILLGGFSMDAAALSEGAPSLSIEQASDIVEAYLDRFGDPNLTLAEVMAFDNHFYASVKERDSGMHAFELLVDRFSGQVVSEPGPNMMWNTKYNHMNMGILHHVFGAASVDGEMAVSPDEARQTALQFLDRVMPGSSIAEEVDRFYGYYTLHILRGNKPIGMLSVNGQSGQVWVHGWHGELLDMRMVHNAQ